MTAPPATPPAGVPDGAVLFDRPAVGSVVVTGPDAHGFLQSLLSQDLDAVPEGGAAGALLLTPRGRIEAALRAVRRGPEEWWLDCEASDGPRLAARLEAYRIRVDVRIDDRSGGWGCLVVRGPAAPGQRAAAEAAAGGAGEGAPPEGAGAAAAVVGDGWPGAPGFDVLGPREATDRVARELLAGGVIPGDAPGNEAGYETGYEVLRIACGIPRPGAEIDERTLVQEAFLDRDAVSFDKGCFVGQEVVGRVHARGHVNRLLRHVRPADPTQVLDPGAEVSVGGRPVGTVTSSTAGLALGYVRREVEPPAGAEVDGRPVRVEQLPGH